jgi:hypothetical protein
MSRANMPAASRYASSMATSRQHVNVDLDAEVASILRSHAAEAHVSEGEIYVSSDEAVRFVADPLQPVGNPLQIRCRPSGVSVG